MRADVDHTRVRALAGWLPAIAALACFAVFAAWVVRVAPQVGNFSDSVEYLVMSDFFAGHYEGNQSEHSVRHFGVSRFPPLYPLTLALGGASTADPSRALLVTLVQALLALVAVAWWLRRTTAKTLAASLLVVPLAACAGWLLLVLDPVSEPLFMLLLFAALACAELLRERRISPWLFCAVAAMLPLARTAGLVLVAVALPWLWLHGFRRSRFFAMAACLCLPALAWSAYRRLLPVNLDYAGQLTLSSVLQAFGGWEGWLLGQWPRLGGAIVEVLHPDRAPIAFWVAAILLLPTVVGFLARARAACLDAWFLAGYGALVFAWPFPAEQPRLLLVVLPILALFAWSGVLALCRLVGRPCDARLAAGLVAFALALPAMAFGARVVHRIAMPVDPALAVHKATPMFFAPADDLRAVEGVEVRERLLATMRELPATVPRGECVYSVLPALAWLVAGAEVAVTPIPDGIASEAQADARLADCRYLLVAWVTTPQHGQQPLYPYRWLRASTRPVLVSQMKNAAGRELTAVALIEQLDWPRGVRATNR